MKRIQDIYKKVKLYPRIDWIILIIFLSFSFLIYSFISVSLHNRFMTFGLDLGYFDEAIWKASRGKFPYSGVGCIWLLEDHFQPILYFLAPLYWLWDDVRVLLVFQSLMMVIVGVPLYFFAKKITNHSFFSLSIVFAYLFFIGTQFSILNEFHQITLAPFFIALFYLALLMGKRIISIVSIVALLMIKEDLSLLVASMGLGLFLNKKTRRLGMFLFVLGISIFLFLIYIFMPAISYRRIYSHLNFGELGFSPHEVLTKVITDPLYVLRILTTPAIKIRTFIISFLSFTLLPLASPIYLLTPLIQDFLIRFIYSGPQYTKWALVNHHAATSSILLSLGAISGAMKIAGKYFSNNCQKFLTITSFLLIMTTISLDIFQKAPIHSLLKKSFYQEEKWLKDIRDVVSKVPPDASLAAQNNILPHLTHRDSIYRVPYGLNSEYMVVDLREGPNKYAPLSYEEMKDFVQELLTSKR